MDRKYKKNNNDEKNFNINNDNNNVKHEVGEDATKYGEFISSFFTWITPNSQKNRAEELENMTKDKEKDK